MWNGERFLGVALRHLGRTEEAIAQTLFVAGRKNEAAPLCEEIIERARRTGRVPRLEALAVLDRR